MEIQNTHFVLNNISPEHLAICEIMWTNTVQPDRPQIIIWRMRIACWVPKATNTHMLHLSLFHCNNGYANAAECYVTRTVFVLLRIRQVSKPPRMLCFYFWTNGPPGPYSC
jgi:hypothetical protein